MMTRPAMPVAALIGRGDAIVQHEAGERRLAAFKVARPWFWLLPICATQSARRVSKWTDIFTAEAFRLLLPIIALGEQERVAMYCGHGIHVVLPRKQPRSASIKLTPASRKASYTFRDSSLGAPQLFLAERHGARSRFGYLRPLLPSNLYFIFTFLPFEIAKMTVLTKS